MSKKLTTWTPKVSALSIPALNDGVFRAKVINQNIYFNKTVLQTLV